MSFPLVCDNLHSSSCGEFPVGSHTNAEFQGLDQTKHAEAKNIPNISGTTTGSTLWQVAHGMSFVCFGMKKDPHC
jgi:hypothetical protein